MLTAAPSIQLAGTDPAGMPILRTLNAVVVDGAVDEHGQVIATARAIADGAKFAWIYDVVVADAWQGRGLGDAVMRLLLDHPAVRGAGYVALSTKDKVGFYERLGFVARAKLPTKNYTATEMVRRSEV